MEDDLNQDLFFHADLAENQDHDIKQLETEGGDDVMLDEAFLHQTSDQSHIIDLRKNYTYAATIPPLRPPWLHQLGQNMTIMKPDKIVFEHLFKQLFYL